MLPCSYIFYFGFAKGAALGQLANGSLRDLGVATLLHDVWEHLVEEFEDVFVDLLELQQERVVTFRTVDFTEPGIADVVCDFLLLCKSEETVALDAQNECWLLDQGQSLGDVGRPISRDVVRVELPGYCYVAVAVKSLDKFLSCGTWSAQHPGKALRGAGHIPWYRR